MDINELEQSLADLNSRYKQVLRQGAMTPSSQEQLRILRRDILEIERRLAHSRNEEYAEPWILPFPRRFKRYQFPWLLSNGMHTTLLYEIDPTDVSDPEDTSLASDATAIARFGLCTATRLGTPNDEVIEGHSLYRKGIDISEAYIVRNSRWIEELEAINRVHSQYNPAWWKGYTHYLIFFKDHTFECVARTVAFRAIKGTFEEAVDETVKSRLFK